MHICARPKLERLGPAQGPAHHPSQDQGQDDPQRTGRPTAWTRTGQEDPSTQPEHTGVSMMGPGPSTSAHAYRTHEQDSTGPLGAQPREEGFPPSSLPMPGSLTGSQTPRPGRPGPGPRTSGQAGPAQRTPSESRKCARARRRAGPAGLLPCREHLPNAFRVSEPARGPWVSGRTADARAGARLDRLGAGWAAWPTRCLPAR